MTGEKWTCDTDIEIINEALVSGRAVLGVVVATVNGDVNVRLTSTVSFNIGSYQTEGVFGGSLWKGAGSTPSRAWNYTPAN